jgi:exosortase/archaeosortase family protein
MNKYQDIFLRYILIILVALPNLYIFYLIFTPLTLYPLYFLFNLFIKTSLENNILFINGFAIEIIKACVAGSAYYLLFILNMSVPNIKLRKRAQMIIYSFALFLFLNILRIIILSLVLFSGSSYFDITHKFFWYFVSTLLVVLIWFAEVKIFNIKDIPIYSDLKFLFKKSLLKKQKKS